MGDTELQAEWLDVKARIEAVDSELRELRVLKRSESTRTYELRRIRVRLVRVRLEWEELIRESSTSSVLECQLAAAKTWRERRDETIDKLAEIAGGT